MGRFNTRSKGPVVRGPIRTEAVATGRTAKGAPGFTRDAKSELFLLAVSNFVGQDQAHEQGAARDDRFASLIREVAVTDPGWMMRFLPWLRNKANMRSASLTGAIIAGYAMVEAKIPGCRTLLNSVLVRADEPGEALAYVREVMRRKESGGIQRGIADAAARLYNERNTLKWDTASHAYRFGDVLELCHPAPLSKFQIPLFKHLIDRRHGRGGIPSSLTMLHNNAKLREAVARGDLSGLLDPQTLREAGMTWEDVLSLAGDRLPKRQLWEAMIPQMGYFALLRNLRNFDQAGVSDRVAQQVYGKLTDPGEVAASRMLPMRFLSAYRAAPSLRWSYPLEQALQLSLGNVPSLPGRTLILIDTSGSMRNRFYERPDARPRRHSVFRDTTPGLALWDVAELFGLALAQRAESADVVSFSNSSRGFPPVEGESLLSATKRFADGYRLSSGTRTAEAVARHFNGHNRVVILTDEQADYHDGSDVTVAVPRDRLVVTFNLAGYRYGHAPSGGGSRVTIGGLSDRAFDLLPVLDARHSGQWPF